MADAPLAAHELVAYLDRMEEESTSRQDETGLKDATTNLDFARGNQWPSGGAPGLTGGNDQEFKFTINLIDGLLKRKTALLTDTRPQIEVTARALERRNTAEGFKAIVGAQWEEQSLEQQFARQLMRAGTLGSVACFALWNKAADYGRGDVNYLFYDPRHMILDPSIQQASQTRMAEFMGFKQVVALNWVREAYPIRGPHVKPSERWSKFTRKSEPSEGSQSWGARLLSPVSRAWSKGGDNLADSATPRTELRHMFFKDWPRDERKQPKFGLPRLIRHTVDAGGEILADEVLPYWHAQYPGHLFDWGMEFEHPYGVSEVHGLRRIQYTLNRLVGQIVQNTLLTNRVILTADTDAVDAKTWALLTSGFNGIAVRKKIGRTFTYQNPLALPPSVLALVQLLITAFDLVSGMSDASRGMRPPGVVSGVAIDSLQQAAQSIIRLEARAFEDWLGRIFQQTLGLVWQYYTTNRVIQTLGKSRDTLSYVFDRQRFEENDKGAAYAGHDTDAYRAVFQDFQFKVLPGSSLASTRVQRGVMALNLYNAGLLPGAEVLRAAEWPDPEGTYQKASEEGLKKMLAKANPPDSGNGRPAKPMRLPGQRFSGM